VTIIVELFGVARQCAGMAKTEAEGARLGEVLIDLARRYPRLGEECFEKGQLRRGYMANLNGARFISDPETVLSPGDSLLILATDAGG
jgi:molybdopterin converting factor small subunit